MQSEEPEVFSWEFPNHYPIKLLRLTRRLVRDVVQKWLEQQRKRMANQKTDDEPEIDLDKLYKKKRQQGASGAEVNEVAIGMH